MKYGEESGGGSSSSSNMSSSNSSSSSSFSKQPVGIIKKSSLYRGGQPQLFNHHQNVVASRFPNISSTSNDTAINFDDLSVVGYSSNLYRDDFMALKLESRDILIPWNGDENLLIDR